MNSAPITRTPAFHPRFSAEGGRKSIKRKLHSLSTNRPCQNPLPLASFRVGRRPAVAAAVINGMINNLRAFRLRAVFDESPPDDTYKDSQSSSSSGEGSRLRVAYQGIPGAYSEAVAAKAYPNCEAVPCEQFENAFDAVDRGLVERAVLPIENSVGGSIHRIHDLLLQYNLHIVGEVNHAVRHGLLVNHGVMVEDHKRFFSYPQDEPDNITRFLMLAPEPIIPITDKSFKTSIVFSLEEGPGMLFKALAVFAMRDINLTKTESRPRKNEPLIMTEDGDNGRLKYFNYLFYVDFEASTASHNAQNALTDLKEFATFLRVLGSYPRDTNEG